MKNKEKQYEHWKNWYNRNKDEHRKKIIQRLNNIKVWYINYKKTLKCVRCKENDYRCLEFHHKGKKEKNISSAVSNGWSIERIKKEMKKCIVLCANCHKREHYIE